MAYLIKLPTFSDERGYLTVIEKQLPFDIKRVYYIYKPKGIRGGHRHRKTIQALVAVSGSCEIFVHNGKSKETFKLNSPDQLLILECEDWHILYNFSEDCIILVLASEYYDKDDYIYERYPD